MQLSSNNKRKRGFKRNNRNRNAQPLGVNPPAIQGNIRLRHIYRFAATALAENVVQAGSLLAAAGVVCTATNSSSVVLNSGYKIHRITVWAPGISGVTTCRLQWFSGLGGSKTGEVMDTTLSSAVPAHVSSRPPAGSNASFQGGTGSTVVCLIECPAGSIIDVDMTVYAVDDASSISRSIAAGTLGYQYWLALDGTTANLVPVGLRTTN